MAAAGTAASAGGGGGRLTVRAVLRAWAARLQAAGCPEPEREALLIVSHLLGLEAGQVLARREESLRADQLEVGAQIVAQRCRRVPLAYLLGEAYFFGLRLRCDRRALVPRVETELLAEAALEWLRGRPRGVLAELGTGSGCLSIALAVHCPTARLVATDLSAAALALAAENARLHGVEERIVFLCGDLLAPLVSEGLASHVQALVANLPYLAEAEYAAAAPELRYEPRAALVAGPTGLEAYQRLAGQLALLPKLEFLAVEMGASQGSAVRALFARALPGWELEVRRDYAGWDRLLIARLPAGRPAAGKKVPRAPLQLDRSKPHR
jgi:release factor glutamine methyltransferase